MLSAQLEEEESEKIPVFEAYLRKGMITKMLEQRFLARSSFEVSKNEDSWTWN